MPEIPEFEVKIVKEPGSSPTIVACKMPTPCHTATPQGLRVDLVITEVEGELKVAGTVNEVLED